MQDCFGVSHVVEMFYLVCYNCVINLLIYFNYISNLSAF